jgi:hypothetical protein
MTKFTMTIDDIAFVILARESFFAVTEKTVIKVHIHMQTNTTIPIMISRFCVVDLFWSISISRHYVYFPAVGAGAGGVAAAGAGGGVLGAGAGRSCARSSATAAAIFGVVVNCCSSTVKSA